MKLLINTASTFKGGGVQVAKSFINECKHFPEHRYHVILGSKLASQIKIASFPSNFTFSKIDYRPAQKVRTPFYNDFILSKVENEFEPDVVFSTTGPSYNQFKVPHLVGYNLPHYIYPDSPFFDIIPFWKKWRWKLKGLVIKYFYKRDATAIVGQTKDVAKKAASWLKINKTFTVSNTFNHFFHQKLNDQVILEKSKKFRLLILSSYHHHKNFQILNQIAKQLEQNNINNIQFVLTLNTDYFDTIFSTDAKKHIINIGPVQIHNTPYLYRDVDALFQPSLLECFSANFPEAMKMERPIITTDLSFTKGVCGAAAIYYKATDANDAYEKIIQLSKDTSLRKKMVENGKKQLDQFPSAGKRAQNYLNACKELLKSNN